MSGFDTEWTSKPVCPHCGFEDDCWWDSYGDIEDGESRVTECVKCEKEFIVKVSFLTKFETKKEAGDE